MSIKYLVIPVGQEVFKTNKQTSKRALSKGTEAIFKELPVAKSKTM